MSFYRLKQTKCRSEALRPCLRKRKLSEITEEMLERLCVLSEPERAQQHKIHQLSKFVSSLFKGKRQNKTTDHPNKEKRLNSKGEMIT